MDDLNSSSTVCSCAILLRRLRRQVPHHPLFDEYAETLFELVSKGQDYRNAPEMLELKKQLQALEDRL